MSKLERITVTMPEAMAAKMRAIVDAGEYATTSEIVREALRDWSDQHERREAALAALRLEIEKGLEGPFYDGERVLQELQDRVAALVREQSEDRAA